MLNSFLRRFLPACMTVAFASSAMAAGLLRQADTPDSAPPPVTAINPPLVNWVAPQFFNAPRGAFSSDGSFSSKSSMTKAARTLATFIPVAPCRLVDTRGLFNPVYTGFGLGDPGQPYPAQHNPFADHEVRVYNAAAVNPFTSKSCGIPAGNNRIVAVSVAVTTMPTAASGDVEVIANGQALGGTVLMVVQQNIWNSATTATPVDNSGNFQVQVRNMSADMAIDVNGYYAQMDSNNTTDFFSILGNFNSDGGLLNVDETGIIGAAIRAVSGGGADVRLAQGFNAIDVVTGRLRVRGAGVNTDTIAFVHQTSTGSSGNVCDATQEPTLDAHYTRIENPQTFDGTGTADLSGVMVFAQQRGNAAATTGFGRVPHGEKVRQRQCESREWLVPIQQRDHVCHRRDLQHYGCESLMIALQEPAARAAVPAADGRGDNMNFLQVVVYKTLRFTQAQFDLSNLTKRAYFTRRV